MKILVIGAEFRCQPRLSLGFTAGTSFDDIIRVHIEDELNNRLPEPA